MIFERIARFVRAQDWNAIVIEFAIVTAGVLMGIQVSNWNDARVEKAKKLKLAKDLERATDKLLSLVRREQR